MICSDAAQRIDNVSGSSYCRGDIGQGLVRREGSEETTGFADLQYRLQDRNVSRNHFRKVYSNFSE